MPRTKISEFSATASDNTDIDGINLGEGMLPSDVNNSIRELMAQLKDFQTGAGSDSFGGPIAPTSPSTIVVNSTSAALRVTQTGTGNALLVEDSANVDATPFVIDADGNIVSGATSSIGSLAITREGFNTITHQSTATSGGNFFNQRRSLGTAVSPTIITSGTALGEHAFFGYDGASYVSAARIRSDVDGTPGTNDMPGRLVFSTTAAGASSPTERMRIANNGAVGIGSTDLSRFTMHLQKTITGNATSYGILSDGVVQSDVTTNAFYNRTGASTVAASFTLNQLTHYDATQNTIGAGSAVTTQIGFNVSSTLVGASFNYGFYGNIASGTNRWNLHMAGTAENYLGGNLKVGSTAARGTTAGTNHLSIFNGTAPAGTLTNGITLYSASGDLNFMDSSGNGYQVGFRTIPQNSQSAAYTLVLADSGKHILHPSADTTARTFTIPANGSVAFPIGTAVTFINQNGAGAITIAITTDTMRLAGAGTTGSRTLAANGVATAIKITSTEWIISGTGLT